MQAAVEQQIRSTNPRTKVGLVTFSDEVTVVGDGSSPPLSVGGDRLTNYDYLVESAKSSAQRRMN